MIIDKTKTEKKEFDFLDSNGNYLISVIANSIDNALTELKESNFDISLIDKEKTFEISNIYGVIFQEKEIQKRLKFIKDTIIEVFDNYSKVNFEIAFNNLSQKNSHFYEAFKTAKELIVKEFTIPLPSNKMYDSKENREKIDKLKGKLIDICNIRGSNDRFHKEKLIYNCLMQVYNL